MVFSAHSSTVGARIRDVTFTESDFSVVLDDGKTVTRPLSWFPRLARASSTARQNWELTCAGYGLHWPDVDEDISLEALLAGARAPVGSEEWRSPFLTTGL